jgi:hypothetical protein
MCYPCDTCTRRSKSPQAQALALFDLPAVELREPAIGAERGRVDRCFACCWWSASIPNVHYSSGNLQYRLAGVNSAVIMAPRSVDQWISSRVRSVRAAQRTQLAIKDRCAMYPGRPTPHGTKTKQALRVGAVSRISRGLAACLGANLRQRRNQAAWPHPRCGSLNRDV